MKDEAYVIDLCDEVLKRRASRQHSFDFLCGDTGRKLPCDAYYSDLRLVIEYREQQHFERVPFWDTKPTASGIPRGQQRALYDQRRRDELPKHGITLIELSYAAFAHNGRKRLLRASSDKEVVRRKLAHWSDAR
ncbi:MAG: hypothetical protein ACU0DI_16760 [Paracoccaceae bacterium]